MSDCTITSTVGLRSRGGILAAVCCFALLAGCTQLPPSAVQQLEQARRAYDGNSFPQCERLCDPVIASHNDKDGIAEAYYLRGLARLEQRHRREAWEDLDEARVRSDDPLLRAYAETQLGNISFDNRQYQQACFFYQPALDNLEGKSPTDRILYQYALALQRGGRFDEAARAFDRLKSEYPRSQWSTQSNTRRTNWQREYFTVQCGVFTSSASAQKLADKLRQYGLSPRVEQVSSTAGQRYYVRVGSFSDHASAEQMLRRIRTVQPDAFIVP